MPASRRRRGPGVEAAIDLLVALDGADVAPGLGERDPFGEHLRIVHPDALRPPLDAARARVQSGDGDNQFETPAGVASVSDDEAFVVDTFNFRIQKTKGATIDTFGAFGDGEGQFLQPNGIAINQENRDIYVSDVARHNIIQFRSNGQFVEEFGTFGSGREQFSTPSAIAIDPVTAQLFVTDTNNHRIQRLTDTLFSFGPLGEGRGNGPGEFERPEGIAIDANRKVYVADTGNNRIQVFDLNFEFQFQFGEQGNGPGEFNGPASVAIDRNGNVFVVDRGNNRIQEFTNNGTFVKAFGKAGSGLGEFDTPFGITVDDDDAITVTDQENNRVQIFAPVNIAQGPLLRVAPGEGKRKRTRRGKRR